MAKRKAPAQDPDAPKSKAGRPPYSEPAFSEELIAKIEQSLRDGNFFTTACALHGISVRTVYRWIRADKDGDIQYSGLMSRLNKAQAEAINKGVNIIQRAGEEGDWQATRWWLSRRDTPRWGDKKTVEHTGAKGGAIEIKVDHKHALAELLGLETEDDDECT